jgi:hypothetical protein
LSDTPVGPTAGLDVVLEKIKIAAAAVETYFVHAVA